MACTRVRHSGSDCAGAAFTMTVQTLPVGAVLVTANGYVVRCRIHPAEGPITRFPVSCRRFDRRPSLPGSSCARWGVAPSSRSAYRRRSAGPQRGCRVAHEQDPTGQGALLIPGTVVRSRPATILRPAPAALPRPVPMTPLDTSHRRWLTFTRRHQGFTHVRPSPRDGWLPPRSREASPRPPVFSSPARPPDGTRAASASTPGFAPRGYPRRTPRRRQALRALARVLHLRHQSNLQRCLPLSLMHPHCRT